MSNKTKINSKAFDRINRVLSYFLGLYFADGCICSTTLKRKIVSMGLNDKDTIKKLCKWLGAPYSVIHENHCYIGKIKNARYTGKINYTLQFSDTYLYEKLKKLGCVERKSRIVKRPRIPKKYYWAFLMGLFDGDGSTSCNRSINQWKASIGTGSFELGKFIEKILKEQYLIYNSEIRSTQNGKFYNLTLNGLAAKTFLRKLYSSVPPELPMKRKKRKYEQLAKQNFKYPRIQEWEKKYMKMDTSVNQCFKDIMSDKRNFGWKRSKITIYRYKSGQLK